MRDALPIAVMVLAVFAPQWWKAVGTWLGVPELAPVDPPSLMGAVGTQALRVGLVAALAVMFFGGRELGLYRPLRREGAATERRAWVRAFLLAMGAMAFAHVVRGMTWLLVGQPANAADDLFSVAQEIVVGAAAGPYEELASAVLLLLLLRSKTNVPTWAGVLILAASRGLWHVYQGLGGVIAGMLFGGAFALLFLRYRRVGALICAHTTMNVGGTLLLLRAATG